MRRMGCNFWDRHYRLIAWGMLVCIAFLLLHALELRVTPVLLSAAQTQSKNRMEQIVSQEVQELLGNFDGDFATIERNQAGQIMSIGMNVAKTNLFKAQLSEKLSQKFAELSQEKLSIPLGSLVGGIFFTGRGPEISFRLEPYGTAQVNFVQEFSQAGINQTVFRIQLKVQSQMTLYTGKSQIVPQVDTTFLLEERMITGEVPSLYPWNLQAN